MVPALQEWWWKGGENVAGGVQKGDSEESMQNTALGQREREPQPREHRLRVALDEMLSYGSGYVSFL